VAALVFGINKEKIKSKSGEIAFSIWADSFKE
jgi:hypothetical protein